MDHDQLEFQVTRLSASIPDGVRIEWQGRGFSSGPVTIVLDGAGASRGILDYGARRATADFHVLFEFPEFAEALIGIGVDPAWGCPVRATLRSEGEILKDHSFALSGRCRLLPHAMFTHGTAVASVLPGL